MAKSMEEHCKSRHFEAFTMKFSACVLHVCATFSSQRSSAKMKIDESQKQVLMS